MKKQLRTVGLKSALVISVVLIVTIGVLSLPGKVEGIYSAGSMISCACDGSDYIRFHQGLVVHYSTNHEPADLLGRYEIRSDGRVEIYLNSLWEEDEEVILFTLNTTRLGYAIAVTNESNESYFLARIPPLQSVEDLIARQEIKQIKVVDHTNMVTTFYDALHKIVRKESKSIKNRKAEQGGAGQPPTRHESK